MKLFLLTALTMVAFAANSLLNRLALAEGAIGPGGFAAIRVGSGAAVLAALLILRSRSLPRPARPRPAAIAGLSTYLLGFSFAYVSMDAGLGALILFGGVQVTMFLGALAEGETPPPRRWTGMVLSMAGLAVLTLPKGPVAVPPGALLLMACAAVGWGIYSLAGRRISDPLSVTAWNFLYSLPVVLVAHLVWPDVLEVSTRGLALAAISGGITSALGYALWYSLLPDLGATRGALAQLSAPAIALGLGALVLGESVTLYALLAAAMILGGVAIGLAPTRRRGG
ncbi:DMT family transporter [Tropicimonas sp. IMCC6043]|uniref:DMT family transporter n=1 Tax=Tropicimonas sp. IMCC6043 TaxID=2510645 RepID=UPI00101D40B8|nr:DMT family transporter [Tropicimonas sp. IMCC6043]RYH08974.1 DMT family transporter [Tropicimonas sp. IMCC6043]